MLSFPISGLHHDRRKEEHGGAKLRVSEYDRDIHALYVDRQTNEGAYHKD